MRVKSRAEHCGGWVMFSLEWLPLENAGLCMPVEGHQCQQHLRREKRPYEIPCFILVGKEGRGKGRQCCSSQRELSVSALSILSGFLAVFHQKSGRILDGIRNDFSP